MVSLLAIDTSTEACSAALMHLGKTTQRFEITPRGHAMKILPMVESLLQEASLTLKDLDAIAVARGPGSFTGVRLGVSVAQGLAFGSGLPIISISTLEALAYEATMQGSETPEIIVAALDARMHEIYFGAYQMEAEGLISVHPEEVIKPADLKPHFQNQKNLLGCGHGFAAYADEIESAMGCSFKSIVPDIFPTAKSVAALGLLKWGQEDFNPLQDCMPVYLRNKVV